MLVADHTKMLNDVKALATKQSVTPDTTMDDVKDLMGHSRDELKDLTDKAKGADWDKDFIGKMVDDHQKVLDKLQDAVKNRPIELIDGHEGVDGSHGRGAAASDQGAGAPSEVEVERPLLGGSW